MSPALRLVVGIATAGRREQMRLTLAQLAAQRRQPDRILVCPARPEDYDESSAAPLSCPVEVLRGPAGLCAQRNTILRACGTADVIVFIDDDFYPAPSYLEEIAALFSSRQDIVAATHHPALDGATGPGVSHEEALSALEQLTHAAVPTPVTKLTYAAYGCNMAIRLAPVRLHGLWFDENLPLYGWLEDVDFSRRLAPYGRIVEHRRLQGVHLATKGGRSSQLRLGYSQVANPIYMTRKGSLSASYALRHIGRNVAKNILMSFKPEPWVDRRGRLWGNALAVRDLFSGRMHPRRIEQLGPSTPQRDTSPATPTKPQEQRGSQGATLLLDCSLSLINRTGAHFIAEELSRTFADSTVIRRWRLIGEPLPQGAMRKVLGRMMLKELQHGDALRLPNWPEPDDRRLKRVFLDPMYVLRSRLTRTDVVLCHDVGPLTHPELYDPQTIRMYEAAYAKVQEVGPGMVFVSHASRRAFEVAFGTRYRFLKVIPLYVRKGSVDGAVEPVRGVQQPFFLTVGAFERRKNQVTAIEGYVRSGLHQRGYGYVLCGAKGEGSQHVLAMAERTQGVTVLGYVSDAQLRWLYREASAFVLPSLLEGFGMPALEAAQHGLIPIISRESALTEAVGNLGMAVAHDSAIDIAKAMHDVTALTPEQRSEWRQALTKHAATLTRERFVAEWRALLMAEANGQPLEASP